MTKAAGTPAPATFTPSQVAALLGSVSVNGQVVGTINPLPRTDPMVAFGPGVPLIPAPLDPVRQDTGRPEPRLTEYPVSTNIPGVSDRLVPWKVLRDAAGVGGLARRCIEIRKAEVATLDWTIAISQGAAEKAQADHPGMSRSEIEADLGKRLGPDITRCTEFWSEPNPREGENFSEWVSKLLEEHLVLDAIAIYPRRTYGDDLYALEIIDGSTIKVLRDNTGGRPQPPQPAFQQLLWGFPRGEFVADTDAQGQVLNGYRSDHLIYKRRNVRTFTQYGYSAVEQALEDIDVWLRRRKWIRDEYTEGTVPTGLIRNDGTTGWTAQQILEYERSLNDAYAGQTGERHRLRVLPPGFSLETPQADVAEKYRPEYDLYLIKQIAAHFDVTIAELGFTEAGGLGSTGWHEGQADVQHRKATLPTLRWLQQLLTTISRKHLDMPPELEFRFLGLEDEDEAAADQVALQRIQWGRMTLNEDRDRVGQPRYPFPEADMPMVMTTRGVIFLEGASDSATPGVPLTPGSGDTGAQPVPGESAAGTGNEDEEEPGPAVEGVQSEAVKAELAAFRRWSRKNPSPRRPFEFQVVTKADAPALVFDSRVVFAGGDQGPKAADLTSAKNWPGWGPDQKAVAYWVPRIRKAMRGTIDTRRLAEAWIAERAIVTKADEPDLDDVDDFEDDSNDGDNGAVIRTDHDAVGWLTNHGVNLTAALAFINELHAEGYTIGERSATAVVGGHTTVDWSTWKPGHASAARLVQPGGGANSLERLLNEAGITIGSVAAHRMDKLARTLSDALANGDDTDTLAGDLEDVLDDEAWADMVAVTEISRAVSAATIDIYQANGIATASWTTAADERTCMPCSINEDAGPMPVGASFPSGAAYPPQHPRCRCCLVAEASSF
ncbi:phage portal protein [Streptomyces sp. NPDC006739]|uniref:phage portal protein n=1 Tax=Streptomyces sp. NPDC006739 TaxID=3364763 RepID=UPI0036B216B0